MKLLVSKISSLVLLATLRLLAGLLPLKVYRKLSKWSNRGDKSDQQLQRKKKIDLFLSVFLCFGAGLLLSTCFIHMIPEVRDSIETASKMGGWPGLTNFPFAECVVCIGFFIVYFFEEIGENAFGHSHPAQETPVRSRTIDRLDQAIEVNPPELRNQERSHRHKLTAVSETVLFESTISLAEASGEISEDDRSKYRVEQMFTKEGTGSNGNKVSTPVKRREHADVSPDHHNHSHSIPFSMQEKTLLAAVRGFLLVLALSLHSIFEGMAIGLQMTVKDVWFLFAAVTVHELAIMFCIGLEMLSSDIRITVYLIYMVTLALITPLGVGVGIIVTEYSNEQGAVYFLTIGILQGVAAGTLLYVTFMEILERERSKQGYRLLKLAAVLMGFILLSALEAAGGHSHPNPVDERFVLQQLDTTTLSSMSVTF